MSEHVKGLEDCSKFITDTLRETKVEQTEKFVTVSLMMIEAETAPFVPVDTSKLINSAFRKVDKTQSGFEGELSYGSGEANYAVYVHDGGPKNWKKSGASDKFLLKGVEQFIQDDLDKLVEDSFGW